MMRLGGSTKTLVLSVLLLMLSLGTAGADDGLKMVPSDSLFCVRINNLDGALGQVDLFLSGLIPMGVSMPVKAQLGQILGSAQPQGIDMAGSFTLFGPLPGGAGFDPTRIGMLVPISDYEQFISGNANVSTADAAGISKIGPEGNAMLAVTQVGKYALVGHAATEQGLADAKKSLAAGTASLMANLDATELKRATNASVWAYANIQAASQMFGPVIQAKIQEIKQAMTAQGEGEGQMAAAAAGMDMYASMIQTVMDEAKYFSLSLDPSASQVGLALVLGSKPNTSLAETFQAGPSSQNNKFLGYLSDGAVMNFVGSLDSPIWKKYSELVLEMMPQMLAAGASADEATELQQMVNNVMECFSGSFAGSFSANPTGKPPFQIQYVAGLKDTEKFYEVLDSASKMVTSGSIAEFYKNMGMKFSFDLKRRADTYKGVGLDSITFAVEALDADSDEAQVLKSIYGDGLNVQMAAVDNMLVYALTPEPGATVRKLIDQVKAGGSSQAPGEVQSAMQLISGAEQADFFTTINVLRIFQLASAIAPIPIPAGDIPTQSSLAIAGNTGGGKMTLELGVPKQHVLEIMGLVMQMQMQGQQQQQP